MKVTKSEPRITLTVVGEQQREFEEPRVLDQRGFPWEVVSYAETEVTLRPLRADMQWDVSEVWPYSARIAVAQRNRIFDYMAQIEACDFEIKTVFACAEDAIEPNEALRRKNDEVKAGTILITAGGFLWGPLPICPLEKPASWPYRAVTKATGRSVYVEPTGGNRCDVVSVPTDVTSQAPPKDAAEELVQNVHNILDIPPGGVRINLEWGEALAFARSAADLGWERAVALHFPKGLRLGFGHPGDLVDETRIRG
jgi:hypothetical protein